MSIARRRRRFLAWCRYLGRAQVPFQAWQDRAPGVPDPRMSGVVRAWDRYSVKTRHWPWNPIHLTEAAGRRSGSYARLAHDLPRYETVHLPEEAA